MLERRDDGIVKVLPGHPCKGLEASSGKPFRDVFDCGGERCKILWERLVRLGSVRMGKVSTRKAPGNMATSTAAIASSEAEKNLSLSDSMFTPYATDKVNDPVRLTHQTGMSWRQYNG